MQLAKNKEFRSLSVLTDEEFVVQAGRRIQEIYWLKYRKAFNYGLLNFIIVGGKTLGIQEESGKTLYVTTHGQVRPSNQEATS